MISRRQFFSVPLAVALPAVLPRWAQAESWPGRSVRIVVPFPAGGGTDGTARIVAQRLGEQMNQTFFVDNKVGAAGRIGTENVVRSAADGYSLLVAPAALTSDPALYELPYDPQADLAPVSLLMTAPNILLVPLDAPYNTVQDFVAHAKANPGKLTYASSGVGTGQHLAGELFCAQTGVNMLHVPYKGGGPALADLLGGHVSCYFANGASATPHVKAGRLKALGVTSEKRSSQLPDVPTLMEQGVPDYNVIEWAGIFVPAGTPQPIIDRLAQEIQKAIAHEETKVKLQGMGVEPTSSTPAEFKKFVDDQMKFWSNLVKTNNIKAS